MSGYDIVLGQWRGREAAALLKGGLLEDFVIAPADEAPRLGAIYRATLDRPMKGQGGAIVSLGDGAKGYLRQAIKGAPPGTPMLVQVTGYAEAGKAVPVTTRVLFKSRYAIVTPSSPGVNVSRAIRDDDLRDRLTESAHGVELAEGHGAILRTLAEEADPDVLADDLATMAELAAQVMADAEGGPELLVEGPDPAELAWRDWPKPDTVADGDSAFDDHEILDLLSGALAARQPLEGGGAMFVEPTRAMVAIDVNTGGDTSPAAGLKANIAAIRALPRLLRIRGLGGQVVLDLAPFPKKDRVRWEQVARAALKSDTVETSLAGWTPLGHMEMQRKRERPALHEVPR